MDICLESGPARDTVGDRMEASSGSTDGCRECPGPCIGGTNVLCGGHSDENVVPKERRGGSNESFSVGIPEKVASPNVLRRVGCARSSDVAGNLKWKLRVPVESSDEL